MSGPYIQFAGFCDRVLTEADGVISLIRIVDRWQVVAGGDDAPEELPPGGIIQTNLVIMLKPDDARGRHPLRIRMQLPSGAYGPDQQLDVFFEGEDRGVNIVIGLQLEANEGVYWFEVHVGGRRLTKMPLRVTYQRAPHGA